MEKKYDKKVIQYSLDGTKLQEFENATEASSIINYDSIISCCRKKYKTAGGFIWRFEDDPFTIDYNKQIEGLSIKCEICGSNETVRSMAMHLKWVHNIKTNEYVNQYGEFRPKNITYIDRKNESPVKCEICGESLMSHRQLIHHLHTHNDTTWQEYFIKYFFNGIPPKCKCGCGKETTLLRHGKNDKGEIAYAREYLQEHSGCWLIPGKYHHSEETKQQMRLSAIKRIENEKGLYNKISGTEQEIHNFIQENYNGEITFNDKKILSGKEIDIYLPDLKLAIEFNGTYYHSDLFKRDKNCHLKKTKECLKQNIQLIHVWDVDWLRQNEKIKSILLNRIKNTPINIYARKCRIEVIKHNIAAKFLNENHLQGNCISGINLGLYYEDELVSIMTFGKLRKNLNQTHKEGHYELLRFCNKLNTSVVGGASKLLNYFIKNYNPLNIISYANRDISNGNLYNKLGMEYIGETEPGYHWYKSQIRYNRFQFRKSELIKEGYDQNKTEYEIMLERGFHRTWNTGNLKFEWKYTP